MYDPECNIPLSLSQREKEDLQNYYENELRNKDEKIMSLEAENAMLHLRMTKLMHQLKVQAEKISSLSGRIQDQLKERRQWKGSVFSLYTKFLALQDDYELLRNTVATLPSQMRQQCSSLLEITDGKYLRLQEMAADVEALQRQLLERDKLLAEISEQLSKEKYRRRLLHNAVVELRGNIRVHCRVRPLTSADNAVGSDCTRRPLEFLVTEPTRCLNLKGFIFKAIHRKPFSVKYNCSSLHCLTGTMCA